MNFQSNEERVIIILVRILVVIESFGIVSVTDQTEHSKDLVKWVIVGLSIRKVPPNSMVRSGALFEIVLNFLVCTLQEVGIILKRSLIIILM